VKRLEDDCNYRNASMTTTNFTYTRSAMNCIILRNRFGDRYLITFDPAYDPRHRPKKSLDPRMTIIPCRYGEIYPFGGTELVVEVVARSRLKLRLSQLPAVRIHQDADDVCSFVFDANDFAEIAEIVRPRRRRIASDRQRDAARRSMSILNRQRPVPGPISGPATQA